MVHLIGDYYMSADRYSYTVGIPGKMSDRRRENGSNAVVMRQARYYTTLASAVSCTAELALRERIAAGEVQTLGQAVEQLRRIKNEILENIHTEKEG